MADDPLTEAPDWLRIIAERRGITRALALVPARSRSALERAVQPLPPPPTGATTEPARGMAAACVYRKLHPG
jgi:hypothetical protein